MLTKGLLLAGVLSAALVVFPAASPAQSAGDDQYADPFGPVQERGDSEQPPPVQGQTEGSTPTQAEPADPVAETPQASTAQTGDDGETLPRTGFEAWLFAAIGWWMLLSGIALRRVSAH